MEAAGLSIAALLLRSTIFNTTVRLCLIYFSLRLEPPDSPFQQRKITQLTYPPPTHAQNPYLPVEGQERRLFPYVSNDIPRPLSRIQASSLTGTLKPIVAVLDDVFLQTIDRYAKELVSNATGHEGRVIQLNQDLCQRIRRESDLTRKFTEHERWFFLIEAVSGFLVEKNNAPKEKV